MNYRSRRGPGTHTFEIRDEVILTFVSYEAHAAENAGARYVSLMVMDCEDECILALSTGYGYQASNSQYGGFYVGAPNDSSAPNHRHVRNLPDHLLLRPGFKVVVREMHSRDLLNDTLDVTLGFRPSS